MTDHIEIMARAMYRVDFPHWQTSCENHDTSYLGYKLAPAEIEIIAQAAIQALTAAGYQIVQGWQPIETAPKDESWFLMVDTHGDMAVGLFDIDLGIIHDPRDEYDVGVTHPTHWMPLLAPPTAKAQDND